MAVEQGLARQRADRLAADLARQRDYLARLAEVTATLTRDLDLATVLEQVATAGQSLAYAKQVRIWLRSPVSKNSAVRLAAAAPPMPEAPLLTPHEQQALLVAAAKVSDTALILPLIVKDECIGALELRDQDRATFTTGDVQLLQPFANAAAVAIENARLYEQAHLSATLSERNRLARELHDTIAQGLTAVTMQLEAAQRSFERDPSRSRARLGRAYELARATLDDVRRSVWTLAAPLTDGRALRETLEEQGGAFAQRTGVVISYRHAGPPVQLDSAAATQVMRIVQEALHNVEKHAQATEVVIGSQTSFDELRVWVCDNGVGFDPNVSRSNGVNGSGFGLASLHERARLAKGFLEVESGPEIGTTISITIRQSRSSDAEDEHGLYFS
jgi:signal transduction histidine kinase